MNRESDEASLFTPLMPDGTRGAMMLSPSDVLKKKRGGPWLAVVTDLTTGRHYEVEGAQCSMPRCYCDARVVREVAASVETDEQKRRGLEVSLASVTDQIAGFRESSSSLRINGATRLVDDVEEDITSLKIEFNEHIVKKLTEEQKAIRLALLALDQ